MRHCPSCLTAFAINAPPLSVQFDFEPAGAYARCWWSIRTISSVSDAASMSFGGCNTKL